MFIHFWDYAASITFTCKSVSKRSCTFITVITQIRTFFFNLGTSNKNFEATKYSSGKIFSKGIRTSKKLFLKFFRKTLHSYLNKIVNIETAACQCYLESLFKKQLYANLLQIGCSWKFSNIHRKTPVLESLINNVADIFDRTPPVATSAVLKNRFLKLLRKTSVAETY